MTSSKSPRPHLRLAPLWWTIGWLMIAFIIVSSLVPSRELPPILLQIKDKVLHFTGYCGVTFWFCGLNARDSYINVGLILVAMGGLIELTQSAMGLGRHAEWLDFAANTAGVATSLVLAYLGVGQWMVLAERRLGIA